MMIIVGLRIWRLKLKIKFKKSTYYIIKNCLNLVKWEADCYSKDSKEYQWLLDIIVFLDLKLGELIDED